MSLYKIQRELKAPKGQTNKFANFKYRSCEDIVEAVKPLLHDFKYALVMSDDVIDVGGRIYVKASAQLIDEKGNLVASANGYAREAESKKGMDDSQVTGSASSYARKYALNGLFAIDDEKDADSNEQGALKESIKLRGDRQIAKQDAFIRIREFYDTGDVKGLIEESAKLRDDDELLTAVWKELTSKQQTEIKDMMHKFSMGGEK